MKYLDEYRDSTMARALLDDIARTVTRAWRSRSWPGTMSSASWRPDDPREEGALAAVIGAVEEGPARVAARTGLGVTRPLILLAGDQLPRIC